MGIQSWITSCTDGFSQERQIGNFQFGKVYRGVFPSGKNVTVKVWEEENSLYNLLPGDNEVRLLEELELLSFFNRREKKEGIPYHRNLAKHIEHSHYLNSTHGLFIVAYDLDPIDTVQNLLGRGCISTHSLVNSDVFTWRMRIKVALGVASLLKFLHAEHPDLPYLIRNLAASHIMLDQEHEPVLFDFSMISGGILYDKRNILYEHANGCHGYVDPTCACRGAWSDKCDVFSYGVLLLQLVSKVGDLEEVGTGDKLTIFHWAWREYKSSQKSGSSKLNFSLVHPSLELDPLFNCDDGVKVTKLALQCVHKDPQKRPSMKQVHSYLEKLHVALSNTAIQDEGSKLGGGISNKQPDEASGSRHLQEDNNLKSFSYDELRMFTNDFSNENKIDDFQYGKIFHGTIQDKQVVVKMWQLDGIYWVVGHDNQLRLRDEIILLQHGHLICHPNLVKLIGYCREDKYIGIVYDLKAIDTLFNLILKDPQACDVYAYGTVLLNMLCKKVFNAKAWVAGDLCDNVVEQADQEYKAKLLSSYSEWSLEHQSFVSDTGYFSKDAIEVSKLALQCVECNHHDRPTMNQVVKRLMKLHVVHSHADELCINQEELELLRFFNLREEKEGIPYHRNLAKLRDYYENSKHGVFIMVYDLDPIDTVQNLLGKGCISTHFLVNSDFFTWRMRIKVALGVASLLKFLHAEHPDLPYLIRNLAASHIMLDQKEEPVLFDFSMISGGILYDKRNILYEHANGCHGYVDPTSACPGAWSDKCDVFSYGVLLLQLVSKIEDLQKVGAGDKQTIFDWAWGEYKSQKSGSSKLNFSLVHPSLESDPLFNCDDGVKVTKLALQCVHNDPRKRPSMKQVHSHLVKLHVALSNAAIQGEGSKLGGGVSNKHADEVSGRRHLQEDNNLKIFSYDELRMFSNDFSNENRIDNFQYGKMFHGTIQDKQVVVKIWQIDGIYWVSGCDNQLRLRDEIILLQHPQLICHPNLVKLIGYCRKDVGYSAKDKYIGIVYDLKAEDTLFNLILKDRLTWLQIIKIGIGFASLLAFLHTENSPLLPYAVRNISASHIILDQDFFPKLIDYGQFAGGILPDSRVERYMFMGCAGYQDVDRDCYTNYPQACDVYAYGTVLVNMLCKKVFNVAGDLYNNVVEWAEEEYKTKLLSSYSEWSLEHQSFVRDTGYYSGDAIEVSKLALQCVECNHLDRPTMDQVVKRLMKLHVVHTHAYELCINQVQDISDQKNQYV
ncbi:hypothetical protein Tsubulata_043579 [Turnera subulata]|uniref:Protein kinase domain-containing protein n=1 Tax=Turnera subulata TaxID=218843 RepID=A0A9Q0JQ01_9ROSI|nr:hypothetical protein Tsubulata_043579 [Turnera subulata]